VHSCVSVIWMLCSSRERQDGERAHALRAVDEHTFDISGRGRTSVKNGVVPLEELGSPIGVMQIQDNIHRIRQHD
jgi:hypothetical protein